MRRTTLYYSQQNKDNTERKRLHLNEIQKLIDSHAYPPTHTYKISPLEPTGVLAERLAIINKLAPTFFGEPSNRFLDVGCNKGFFCLKAMENSSQVIGLEPSQDLTELLSNFSFYLQCSFDEYETPLLFDRILIGNVHHYLFIESRGWGWVKKLANLCEHRAQVIIEGPRSMSCPDMKDCIPKELQSEFTVDEFDAAMLPHFKYRHILPSPSYTPERYVMSFVKI